MGGVWAYIGKQVTDCDGYVYDCMSIASVAPNQFVCARADDQDQTDNLPTAYIVISVLIYTVNHKKAAVHL